MNLSASDIDAIYSDSANLDPIIRWNGDGCLYAHILNHIFRDERAADAANLPTVKPDGEDLHGRFCRQRLAM